MIKILNLDPLFCPVKYSEIGYSMVNFNGGEWHIQIHLDAPEQIDKVILTHRVNNSNAVMQVLLAKDALDRLGIKEVDLIIPYLPYARQDRFLPGEAFGLKLIAKMLNSANFNKILLFDVHSEISLALLDKGVNIKNHQFVKEAIYKIVKNYPLIEYQTTKDSRASIINTLKLGDYCLISPDSGANKKSNALYEYLLKDNEEYMLQEQNPTFSLIKCDKKRNMGDGQLSGFEIFTDSLQGKTCIIVDDICSRGGTFMGIAKALKEKGAGDIYLIVSHWENVADEEALNDVGIVGIYKTNSMNDYSSDFVHNIIIEL